MNLRRPANALLAAGCLVAVAAVLVQHSQIARLRAEAQRVRQERMAAPAAPAAPPAAQPEPVDRLSDAEEGQLLRLRSQVTMLLARRRELASVRAENDQLRSQLAASRTNAAAGGVSFTLPPGYIRRSEAQYVGFAAPEATLQSRLWATQNQDTNLLLQAFTPQVAEHVRNELERLGAKGFFQRQATELPGFLIKQQTAQPDGTLELEVEIVPGTGSQKLLQKLLLRQIGGQWRIDSGF